MNKQSQLKKLIAELCPDGVEHQPLHKHCIFSRGESATRKQLEEGTIPVIAGGRKPAYYTNRSNRIGDCVTVAGSGAYAGFVSYWKDPVFVSDAFTVDPVGECSSKFLYYLLSNIQEKIYATQTVGGIPHVYGTSIANFAFPFPPLPVQEEIVRILDTFTALEAELEAELEARTKQYKTYREKLLSSIISASDTLNLRSEVTVEWKKLGDVCVDISSGRNKDRSVEGKYPVYGSTGIIAYSDDYRYDKGKILVARVGANCGKVHRAKGRYDVSDNTLLITPNDQYNLDFAYYQLTHMDLNRFAVGGGQPLITAGKLKKLEIPIPPLTVQQEIVAILDRFDALVNDLKNGLPAEIALRRKQYEYYRDQLLTFKPLE